MRTNNKITDLNQKRTSYSMLYKTVNAQRAIAFCDSHDFTPIHINVDESTDVPIITILSPAINDPIFTAAIEVGSKMMSKQITFAGQPIADLIWTKPLNA